MNDILLHIGYHKTGTTFLQNEVFSNPELPFNLIDRSLTRKEIIRKNMFVFNSDQTRSLFNEKFKNDRINVVSNEAFIGNPHAGGYTSYDNFLKLKSLFPQAKILICIREQHDMILSSYKQYIKTIGTLSLNKYLVPFKESSFLPEFNLLHFCYDKLIAAYINAFGKKNVLVLPYELIKANPEEFLNRIFEFLELDTKDISKVNVQKQFNAANLNLTLKTKRLYNILFTKTRENPHGLLSLSRSINQPLFKSISFFEKKLGKGFQKRMNKKQMKIIQKVSNGFYAESNQKTSELIGINLSLYGYES